MRLYRYSACFIGVSCRAGTSPIWKLIGIKREWLNRFKIRDYKQAYHLIFEYLEAFYNTKRIHSHCDFMLPDEFERVYEKKHTKAELLAS